MASLTNMFFNTYSNNSKLELNITTKKQNIRVAVNNLIWLDLEPISKLFKVLCVLSFTMKIIYNN